MDSAQTHYKLLTTAHNLNRKSVIGTMNWTFNDIIALFSEEPNRPLLLSGLWGLEKEALRVKKDGTLALTSHPAAFGDKLTNPLITTDFSESQPELITPPFSSVEETHRLLDNLQKEVEEKLEDEYLWPLSMPCRLPDEEKIPIARYGDSEEGRKKEAYREYLARQYGKKMQMISGIHFNFSFSSDFFDVLRRYTKSDSPPKQFADDAYFALGRNFLRFKWLLVYLFGASPVTDKSYEKRFIEKMQRFGGLCPCHRGSYFLEHATSLRMSHFGYSSNRQDKLMVSHNNLAGYLNDLKKAMAHQVLTSENEYYSLIRFKQTPRAGESQLDALAERGVDHVEIRAVDLDPFEPTGIGLEQLHFLQLFALLCLFEPSGPINEEEWGCIIRNHTAVALEGRKKGLTLEGTNGPRPLKEWAKELLDKMATIATLMDENRPKKPHSASVNAQMEKLERPDLLPSAKIIEQMRKKCESFVEFGLQRING